MVIFQVLMLSKDRIFTYIFLFNLFPGMILSYVYVKFIDELVFASLLGMIALECYVEGKKAFQKYQIIWVLSAIMIFYAIYSIVFVHFNSPIYVLSDLIVQIKPFFPFFIVRQMGVTLLPKYKPIAKVLCLANAFMMIVFYVWGHGELMLPFGHIASLGATCMISSLVYLLCSRDDNDNISIKDLIIAISILTLGLICRRSKYYGEYVIVLALLYGYRPGLFRNISFKHVLTVFAVLGAVVLVSWQKIQVYFIQGAIDMLQNESLEAFNDSFARPMLYVTGGQILLDYFPFGSGLASFASNASAVNYSTLYYDYGLDKVWGLSPSKTDFICDAYYPSLCQFGVVGVCLFIYLWKWMFGLFLKKDDMLADKFRLRFIIGISLIAFILIECIGGTSFTQSCGLQAMIVLAMILDKETCK